MSSLYPLLYLPLAGLSVLWLLLLVKLLRESRNFPIQMRRKGILLLVVLALFTSGLAVSLITHGHSFKIAAFLLIAAGFINIFVTRMETLQS